jgi:hypothetical protein
MLENTNHAQQPWPELDTWRFFNDLSDPVFILIQSHLTFVS